MSKRKSLRCKRTREFEPAVPGNAGQGGTGFADEIRAALHRLL